MAVEREDDALLPEEDETLPAEEHQGDDDGNGEHEEDPDGRSARVRRNGAARMRALQFKTALRAGSDRERRDSGLGRPQCTCCRACSKFGGARRRIGECGKVKIVRFRDLRHELEKLATLRYDLVV